MEPALDAQRVRHAAAAPFGCEKRQRIVDPQVEVVLAKRLPQEGGEGPQPLPDHEEAAGAGLDVLASEHGRGPREQSPKRLQLVLSRGRYGPGEEIQ